jgi:anionic cell wall polymer biosynthesis LytR-Cps2A-Psr (LCP) family protein
MFGKKRGFSPKQSNRELRSMDKHTIGSHVRREPAHGKRANSRKNKANAQFGANSNVQNASLSTLKSVSHTSTQTKNVNNLNSHKATNIRARHSSTIAEEAASKAGRKRFIALGIAVVLVLAVACAVGVIAFNNSTNAKLGFDSNDVKDVLVEADASSPYYVLLSADAGYFESAPVSYTSSNSSYTYILVRVDEQSSTLSFMAIPANLQVRFNDYTYHPLYAAQQDGDAEVISLISQFAGVDISHFVKTTPEGISALVDELSGVAVTLPETADDPYAGNKVFDAGNLTVDGKSMLTLLRNNNFSGGVSAAQQFRVDSFLAISNAALGNSGISLATLVSSVSDYISTDLSTTQIVSIGEKFSNLDSVNIYTSSVAGYSTTDSSGTEVFVTSDDAWATMLDNYLCGEDPNAQDAGISSVDASQTTVEVRNGAGITGAGAQMQSILAAAGFNVTGVGNTTDGATYPETLVVYTSSEYENQAKAVVAALGCGRTVNGGDYYSSSAQVIAIVGVDWSPVS